MWMMPEITRRSSTLRAPGWFFGRCGSIRAQASSGSQNSDPAMPASIERSHGINQMQRSQDADWVWTLSVDLRKWREIALKTGIAVSP
jgi:hypothetical protein